MAQLRLYCCTLFEVEPRDLEDDSVLFLVICIFNWREITSDFEEQ